MFFLPSSKPNSLCATYSLGHLLSGNCYFFSLTSAVREAFFLLSDIRCRGPLKWQNPADICLLGLSLLLCFIAVSTLPSAQLNRVRLHVHVPARRPEPL